jgi:hypothetical protein
MPTNKEEVKMKFVIKDDKQKAENVEVELSLEYTGGGNVYLYANKGSSDEKVLMKFKDGKFYRLGNVITKGIVTNSSMQIMED